MFSVLKFTSSDLFQLISFDLMLSMPSIGLVHLTRFHTFAFPHETAGGWPLQTPFLRYLPDVNCDPKSMAGNPRRIRPHCNSYENLHKELAFYQ